MTQEQQHRSAKGYDTTYSYAAFIGAMATMVLLIASLAMWPPLLIVTLLSGIVTTIAVVRVFTTQRCPACRSSVPAGASICRACRSSL